MFCRQWQSQILSWTAHILLFSFLFFGPHHTQNAIKCWSVHFWSGRLIEFISTLNFVCSFYSSVFFVLEKSIENERLLIAVVSYPSKWCIYDIIPFQIYSMVYVPLILSPISSPPQSESSIGIHLNYVTSSYKQMNISSFTLIDPFNQSEIAL